MNLRVANKRCKCQVQHREWNEECNQEVRMRVSKENWIANEMFQGEVQLRALVRVAYQR